MKAMRPGAAMPKKALVVGLGISGRSVCELLFRHGVRVTATDLKRREEFGGMLDSLEAKGCGLRLGTHRVEDFLEADQIIVSPGIPLEIEPLRKAAQKGIEIVGELEWAWRMTTTPVIAVTGTNGKTTTTSLIGEMLRRAGKQVFVGGNIGTPLSEWVASGREADFLVLEVSSFQLDTAPRFCPEIGILLNVTEDHLDRYDGFSSYADSKLSLFKRQTSSHLAILNGDDPVCTARAGDLPGRVLFYSRNDSTAHAVLRNREVRVRLPGGEDYLFSLKGSSLRGVHNEENILAAGLVAASLGIPREVLEQTVRQYRVLPHRLQWVRTWMGIDFYDDSKGTNVGAVVKALENFRQPVLLLLGGKDKLGSYSPIGERMKRLGKAVYAFGEAAPRMVQELDPWVSVRSFANLPEAFREAVKDARSGDV
ncbi:MAG TPA: UDP-N-acetylmuramoyl-L-alanine--D-glutamate ligase, partial [Syntrophobacteraceae bacterium]|nr:UDP-N-acetylmuramoyl-L-alanine--D-glutamate ligase [Syntrophobacteraceae bacterium]